MSVKNEEFVLYWLIDEKKDYYLSNFLLIKIISSWKPCFSVCVKKNIKPKKNNYTND